MLTVHLASQIADEIEHNGDDTPMLTDWETDIAIARFAAARGYSLSEDFSKKQIATALREYAQSIAQENYSASVCGIRSVEDLIDAMDD